MHEPPEVQETHYVAFPDADGVTHYCYPDARCGHERCPRCSRYVAAVIDRLAAAAPIEEDEGPF